MSNNQVALGDIEVGAPARIIRIENEAAVSRRLLEMGIVPGALVRVVKSALFGDPLEIRVRNSYLAVRKSEAALIVVDLV